MTLRGWVGYVVLCVVEVCARAQSGGGDTLEARVLDRFEDVSLWKASASDQVKASLRQIDGLHGQAMCLDYDFNGVSGYAFARRTLPLAFPSNYRFDLRVRGDAPSNHLEVKWVDASGDNVWWATRRDFMPPADWENWAIKKRHIAFAWGPTKDTQLRQTASLELVVSSGQGGGRGSVCFDELRLTVLPEAVGTPAEPKIFNQALTSQDGAQALIDFGGLREFGGLVLHWGPAQAPLRYDVQFSTDRQTWTTVRSVRSARGLSHYLLLSESETRYVRLLFPQTLDAAPDLAGVEVRDVAFGASPNAFFQAVAMESVRGLYPRGFSGEQNYWTLVGVDGGSDSGLISEDGAIEVGKGGFSIEPFLLTDDPKGTRVTWAQVQSKQSLQDGYLPIPRVHWDYQDLALDVSALGMGTPQRSQILARYTLSNYGSHRKTFKLVLAVRPFQVNPPMQFLNTPGGVHSIREFAWDRTALSVNGRKRVWPLEMPSAVTASSFESGHILEQVQQVKSANSMSLSDAFGYASAALIYEVTLPAGGHKSFDLVMPLAGEVSLPGNARTVASWVALQQDKVATGWRRKLNQVNLRVPSAGRPVVDSMRSALAHMLISRDGAALQPGTRSYARSWVRDGAMMVEGLLRLGQDEVASDFVQWFSSYQFASGKVPCCVDKRGADPVPENDSHGQLIFAIAQLYRYTHKRSQLERLWPHVEQAVNYLEVLRQSERIAANRGGPQAAFWGMMPASISHEGYSAKPMHSYWDNFWALRGFKDAAMLASALGKTEIASRIASERDEFQRELHASLAATAQRHDLQYLAGSAELGDFDATSSTVALSPGGEQFQLDSGLLKGTFERYWAEFVARRSGQRNWEDYTPYELRTVGTFVRLGWVDRAQELLQFFFADQRPRGWNQWAEVVGRDLRKPRFVGDMPHAWISSDYIRSALDLFAYEREEDQTLVLAAGIPAAWMRGKGIRLDGLRTSRGLLGYRLRTSAGALHLDLSPGAVLPPGGLELRWPTTHPPAAWVNGARVEWDGARLRVRSVVSAKHAGP